MHAIYLTVSPFDFKTQNKLENESPFDFKAQNKLEKEATEQERKTVFKQLRTLTTVPLIEHLMSLFSSWPFDCQIP